MNGSRLARLGPEPDFVWIRSARSDCFPACAPIEGLDGGGAGQRPRVTYFTKQKTRHGIYGEGFLITMFLMIIRNRTARTRPFFRSVLAQGSIGLCLAILSSCSYQRQPEVMTVRGPIPPAALGKTLPHEHVLCDFIGAKKTSRDRYETETVVRTLLPYLRAIQERGYTGFIDCTPAYIGRDPRLLKRLAELTGLNILTSTGYYGAAGDKFLPDHAFTESADQLAERWIREWKYGIEETGIRPGFIKIGVDPGPLSEVDRKIVQAAARAHLQTGLTVACHTGEGKAAEEVLAVARQEGMHPSALVIVHADGIADQETHFRLAAAGVWVEYDAVGGRPVEEHVRLIEAMARRGFLDRLLLSHDAGWYAAGEPDGGKDKIRPYTAIHDQLVPALKKSSIDGRQIDQLLSGNPQAAFTIRIRRL